MADYRIAVIPGDGIGPEVVREAIKVLRAAEARFGFKLDYTMLKASAALYRDTGTAFPEEEWDFCRKADAILMGACGLPEVRMPDGTEPAGEVIFKLRFGLDLYAGVRPIKLYPGVTSPLRDKAPGSIDYIVLRENIEGLYASRGGGCLLRDEVATDTIIITRKGTEKIVRWAFKLAAKRKGAPLDGKKRVTCVDKSNVLRSYAYFRKVFDEVAEGFPGIERDYAYVDAMTVWMIQKPEFYDIVVAENMFGDIISDEAAATVGGMGMAPSGDVGDRHGLFQPSHGSAPTIAGKGLANPAATILSGALMLDWLGETHDDARLTQAAQRIEQAVSDSLASGEALTSDLGGQRRTEEAGDAVASRIQAV